MAQKRVLAIMAHPDEEVLGCGATLALHARPDQIGVASGLLRTAGYVGAMIASSLIGLTFTGAAGANDLHVLALILTALAAALVLVSGGRVVAARARAVF